MKLPHCERFVGACCDARSPIKCDWNPEQPWYLAATQIIIPTADAAANLPRDLEHSVFGFFDTLNAMELAGRAAEPIEGEDETPVGP